MISELPIINAVAVRLRQGYRTIKFPRRPPVLPEGFRGLPTFGSSLCPDGCKECVLACPTDAILFQDGRVKLDLGRCLFCTECERTCPSDMIRFSGDYRLSTRSRDDLIAGGGEYALAGEPDRRIRRVLGRSLKLRQVSAGGCGACEADTNVLSTIGWDLGRFGIQFVASPRHADGLLITGPVTENMREALKKTYDAIPSPKLVIAVGACAISGGPFIGHPEQRNGAGAQVPVDLYVPGCPPHPATILDGLLRIIGRLGKQPPRDT